MEESHNFYRKKKKHEKQSIHLPGIVTHRQSKVILASPAGFSKTSLYG
jgi:hypothetical protein